MLLYVWGGGQTQFLCVCCQSIASEGSPIFQWCVGNDTPVRASNCLATNNCSATTTHQYLKPDSATKFRFNQNNVVNTKLKITN